MNRWQETTLFLGDLLPLFIIGFVFSVYPLILIQYIIFLAITCFSIYGTYLWINTINSLPKNYNRDTRFDDRLIVGIEERGSIYTVYMVTYISLIPLLSGTIPGLIAFGIIILIVYSLYINTDMLFYNPVLAFLGYRFYRVEVAKQEEGHERFRDEIYVITKIKLTKTEDILNNQYKFYNLMGTTYYIDKSVP